jgi:hypothetical protein
MIHYTSDSNKLAYPSFVFKLQLLVHSLHTSWISEPKKHKLSIWQSNDHSCVGWVEVYFVSKFLYNPDSQINTNFVFVFKLLFFSRNYKADKECDHLQISWFFRCRCKFLEWCHHYTGLDGDNVLNFFIWLAQTWDKVSN